MKTILVDAVNTFVLPGQGIYQPLYDLLETYPHRKIILTNANDQQLQEFGLVDLPYELFSLQHNPDKVNPVYFQKMFSNYQLESSDVIYFEHNPEAVKSAQSVGITSFHYDPDKKDLPGLKEFLDANL